MVICYICRAVQKKEDFLKHYYNCSVFHPVSNTRNNVNNSRSHQLRINLFTRMGKVHNVFFLDVCSFLPRFGSDLGQVCWADWGPNKGFNLVQL